MSGVARNANFGKLQVRIRPSPPRAAEERASSPPRACQAGYLFPEIGRRRSAYLAANPDANIISLGIGDTTQPVPSHILSGLVAGASKLGERAPRSRDTRAPRAGARSLTHERARHATCACRRPRASSALICTLRPAALAPPPRACASRTTQAGPPRLSARGAGTKEGYSGYGAEQGMGPLREKIASALYDGKVDAAEVFVSDGSKCDIGRLQMMFGSGVTSAVQDPSYPVYVDTSVIMGQVRSHCPRDAIVTGRSSQVHAAAALQRPPTAHWRSRGGASSHSRRDRASERHLPPPPPRRRRWTPRASSTATSSTCTASLDALSLSLSRCAGGGRRLLWPYRLAEHEINRARTRARTRSHKITSRSPRDHLEIT